MMHRVLVCATVFWVVGCVWRGYATILSVHVDVLSQTAAKLCVMVEAGKGPAAEGMAEYVYPAKRAREFLRQFGREGQRQSYGQFTALLERYEALVRAVDAARVQESAWQAAWPRLDGECAALGQQAAEVRATLQAELKAKS
jgi:hypothetical protein